MKMNKRGRVRCSVCGSYISSDGKCNNPRCKTNKMVLHRYAGRNAQLTCITHHTIPYTPFMV